MKRLRMGLCLALMLCGTLFAAQQSEAISIVYEAADLADVTVGEDLWQYTYTVSDYDFATYEGFQIFFDSSLYSGIAAISSNADWDILTFEILPDGAYYSAQALIDNASISDPFTVQIIWLGAGTPGAQEVELFYDDGNDFSSTDVGDTVAVVPEPSTWALLAFGLLGLVGFKHRGNTKA